MQIGKAAKNEIALAIKTSSFSPSDFERDEGDEALSVRHRPTSSELVVNYGSVHGGSAKFHVSWSVGEEPIASRETDRPGLTVQDWLNQLRLDLDTPDLWADIGKQGMSALMEGDDNTQFSPQEQNEIEAWANDVKQRAQQGALSDEHMRLLEAKVDYAVAAAGRTGRLDWLNLTVGAVMGAFAGDVLTPDVARGILQALLSLGHLFGHPLPQLPGPQGD